MKSLLRSKEGANCFRFHPGDSGTDRCITAADELVWFLTLIFPLHSVCDGDDNLAHNPTFLAIRVGSGQLLQSKYTIHDWPEHAPLTDAQNIQSATRFH
jgi:hypothetical protein